MRNNYITDSFKFFKVASKNILKLKDNFDVIQQSLMIALGMERLLKGMLYEINPTFIYINPGFDHTLQTLYEDKIIPESKKAKVLSNNPNNDVITFRNCILRAETISKAVFRNKSILFNLSDARDIIAHHELKHFDSDRFRILLERDYYPLIQEFAAELSIKLSNFVFSSIDYKLSKLSSSLQSDYEKSISLLLESHKSKWNLKNKSEKIKKELVERTQFVLKHNLETKLNFNCPACENIGMLTLENVLEYSPFLEREVSIGQHAIKFNCLFCDLEINNEKTLDYLNMHYTSLRYRNHCIKCGVDLFERTITGMCENCEDIFIAGN